MPRKKEPPLTSPAPKANGGILGEVRGTSIDMTLDIVGITEMQKCGLKYVIHSQLDNRKKAAAISISSATIP